MLHTTPAIRYPTFLGGDRNYTGRDPALVENPALRNAVIHRLGPELERVPIGLIVPLGTAVSQAIEVLVREGILVRERCLLGFPHPSGANAHGDPQFARRREQLKETVRRWFR